MTQHSTKSSLPTLTTLTTWASALSLLAVGPLASRPAHAEQATSPSGAALTEWTLDASHSKVGFVASHMVISEVEGQFRNFSGKVHLDEKNPTRSQVELSVQVGSIDTGTPDRDKHLRSPDFFDADKFPTISFKSKQIRRAGKAYKITGELTMRGVTREVTLDATLSDAVANPWGKSVRAAKLKGQIDRRDFGVSWNKSLDKGGLVVGNEVQLEVTVEITK
jgi:polyisoprenoid-binding protein YceI